MAVEVQIVLPAVSEDSVSTGLVFLTEMLDSSKKKAAVQGFLGGAFGYGCEFENDTFMMHPYCWCESDQCPWCAGCECPESADHYFVDGKEVTYDGWMDFYCIEVYGMTSEEHKKVWLKTKAPMDWEKKSDAANARRTTSHDKLCRVCRGEFGNAPNFLHKRSGFSVNWYKYIGRGMEIKPGNEEWSVVIKDCLRSIE